MSVASRKAVFISGQGSNLKALIDSHPDEKFYVFSNKACKGLLWARKRGFSTQVVSLKNTEDWNVFSEAIKKLRLKSIYLLGFMKLVPGDFLKKCSDVDFFNIHPSVLPEFKGLNALESSFRSKKAMGCTLHKVTPLMDEGEVLLQKDISENFQKLDDERAFKLRVHSFEQRLVCHKFELSRGLYG